MYRITQWTKLGFAHLLTSAAGANPEYIDTCIDYTWVYMWRVGVFAALQTWNTYNSTSTTKERFSANNSRRTVITPSDAYPRSNRQTRPSEQTTTDARTVMAGHREEDTRLVRLERAAIVSLYNKPMLRETAQNDRWLHLWVCAR